MRSLLIIALLFFLNSSFGQKQCSCDSNQFLKEIISCDAVIFKNGAKLFTQYNCDSSWLTFQNKKGKKMIIYTLESLVELTGRLGYSYATEYKSDFLIQNNVISGCCDPPEFILFDKETGKEKLNLGRLIFYSDNSRHPIVVYFDNSNYKSFDGNNIDCDHITLRNVDNNKVYKIKIPKGRIKTTVELTEEMFPEHLIDESEIIRNKLILKYRFKTKADNDEWLIGEIIIDLNKYGS